MIILVLIFILIIVIIYALLKVSPKTRIIAMIIISVIILCCIGFILYISNKVNNNLIEESRIRTIIEIEFNNNIEEKHILKQYEELKKLIENKKINALIFNKYDEKFFNNWDLIVYIHSNHNAISKIYKSNDKLNIITYSPGSVRVATEITIIEVEKNSVNEINQKKENEIWWWKLYEYGILDI